MQRSFPIPDIDTIVPPARVEPQLPEPESKVDRIVKELFLEEDPSEIDYKKLLLHLDQSYGAALLEALSKTHPGVAANVADFLRSSDREKIAEVIEKSIPELDADERIRKFYMYEKFPNAVEIRQQAIDELVNKNPAEILRSPSLLDGVDNFKERYLECYNRASATDRMAILSHIAKYESVTKEVVKVGAADASDKKYYPLTISPQSTVSLLDSSLVGAASRDDDFIVTESMLKEVVQTAIYQDPGRIYFDPQWLAKQPWFKEIEHDFNKLADNSDLSVALSGVTLLKETGVEIPGTAIDSLLNRAIKEDPRAALKLVDTFALDAVAARDVHVRAVQEMITEESYQAIFSLGVGALSHLTQDEMKEYLAQAAAVAVVKEPTKTLALIESGALEVLNAEQQKDFRDQAIRNSFNNDPEEFIRFAQLFSLPESSEDNLLYETANSLAKNNPQALLDSVHSLASLEQPRQLEPLLIGAVSLAKTDPEAVLNFRNSNKALDVTTTLFQMEPVKDELIKSCLDHAPEQLFKNLYLLEGKPDREELLLQAASKVNFTDLLRYTGLTELGDPPTSEQRAHILSNVDAMKVWASSPWHADYSTLFMDNGLIRALQVKSSWVEDISANGADLADMRLSVGRNLYFKSKPVTEENVAAEVRDIVSARTKYENIPLFKDRTLLLAINNELRDDGTMRFAQKDFVETLTKESAGKFEEFMAPVGERDGETQKTALLERIRTCQGPITFYLNGHGDTNGTQYVSAYFQLTDKTKIDASDLADAFADRAKAGLVDPNNPDIVIFDCCYGQDAVRNFYDFLKGPENHAMPIGIGQAELGQLGYSNYGSSFGNEFSEKVLGLGQLMKSQQGDGEPGFTPTIGTVIKNQREYTNANSFVYVPGENVPFVQIAELEALKLPPVGMATV